MDEFLEILQMQRHLERVVVPVSGSCKYASTQFSCVAHFRTALGTFAWFSQVLRNGIEMLGQTGALPEQPWPHTTLQTSQSQQCHPSPSLVPSDVSAYIFLVAASDCLSRLCQAIAGSSGVRDVLGRLGQQVRCSVRTAFG